MSTEELLPESDTPAPEADADAAEELASGLDIGSQAADVDGEAVPHHDPVIRGKVDKFGTAWGTGRRKTAVARVRLKDGSGQITVNDRAFEDYFAIERDREMIMRILKATETDGKVDVAIRVRGGGPTGQTGAVVLGIARALQAKNPGLHHQLHAGGFLTRDGRMVERKKYGFKKARRSFQFSKR
ncbi:MAG: 30S ribosomal protein S9 [Planctomycetaceae bacterium]|nr:30S ribosomal protein S9 [Planctomycetaceae bacterium]